MDDLPPYFMLTLASCGHEASDEALFMRAASVMREIGAEYERINVPTVFEIPLAIDYALRSHEFYGGRRRFDGYVALGGIVRADAPKHDDGLYVETLRALQDLVARYSIALGNGVFLSENKKQLADWVGSEDRDVAGHAVRTCHDMLKVKRRFGMHPR